MKPLEDFLAGVAGRDPGQPEFLQSVHEVLDSIWPLVAREPRYAEAGLLERLVEPERVVQFRVAWVDDAGATRVNRAWRVQHSSALGPYKGGLRFHPTVNLSVLKFLAFEQTLKNALTTLPMGGGKGGADFDPKGRSNGEVMRFCQALASELHRHLGPDTDVPAGDIGVGARALVANGVRCVAEGANMPATPEAIRVFHEAGVLFGPGKAANAGGVAVSGLEMSQNAMRLSWTRDEVERRLREIMRGIHDTCVAHGQGEDRAVDYVRGANIAGFVRVGDAMLEQGVT